MLEGFDGYVCDCWWFCLHCSSIMSTTILSKVIYTYTHISYMSISIYYCIYVYLYICNMTWLNNLYIYMCIYQSIKQLLVSKLMSSHSDTAATAVQRRHLALAFKVLPLMVKEKVSARVLTADAPELNFRGKKLEKLIVFRWKVCSHHTR